MVSAQTVYDARVSANMPTFVVLDDDPTGTQSVAGLPVITYWDPDDMRWALGTGAPAIYVMTNTRSMTPEDAEKVNAEVVRTAKVVAEELDMAVAFVSRSDSTLRGHFPLEPDTITQIGGPVDGVLVIPAFPDAGRVTVDGVHFCTDANGELIPVGESEYAKDHSFGYHASNLSEWIEEKTNGRVLAHDVLHITAAELDDRDAVVEKLAGVADGQYVIADIQSEEDLRKLALGVIGAYQAGKTFIHRVGPPYVRALIGMDEPEIITSEQIDELIPHGDTPYGLVVVGSHVPTTTRQLNALTGSLRAAVVELDVPQLLENAEPVIAGAVEVLVTALDSCTAVIHTSRDVIAGKDEAESLAIARTVNGALVETIRRVIERKPPRFVIAKGGITSSDVAKFSLHMHRAMVIGPMEPGIISVWLAQDGPGTAIPYVVFAGNVGSEQSLANAVSVLSKEA
ncbi:four-carbon acid sugar kinase family protein [Stomatohabitans albus]|uniref:four-carbon acid sugar kinase family protein n=1 Tax=Stomatohabitans albus TaxID=3110766 RepID=UPI00300D3B71